MEDKIFEKYRTLIHSESGIYLSQEKKSLLENRIRKRMNKIQVNSEVDYLKIIETDLSGNELIELIDAISTNHTFFFRENAHFDFLRQELEKLNPAQKPEVRIWCAASSSGEEPYSLAIVLSEVLDPKKIKFKLLCTDICTKVLQTAQKGIYEQQKLKDVSQEQRNKYFNFHQTKSDKLYQANSHLKKNILFKRLNLAKFPYPLKGPFDFIFCRNVMIYFQDDLRKQLIHSFHQLLAPNGALVVGMSESLARLEHSFETVGSSTYRKSMVKR